MHSKRRMKKNTKASLCILLGSICLPMAGAESENFVIQIFVTITAAALFVFFFVLAAMLYAQDKAASVEVYKMRALDAPCKRSTQGMENHRLYLPM